MGGKFLLKLNNGKKPIANKYREGKMQRTLKRELKVLEIVKREGDSTSGAVSLIGVVIYKRFARFIACQHEFVSWDNLSWKVYVLRCMVSRVDYHGID